MEGETKLKGKAKQGKKLVAVNSADFFNFPTRGFLEFAVEGLQSSNLNYVRRVKEDGECIEQMLIIVDLP